MRIQVVANCQARPVTEILRELVPHLELQDSLIVHLSKDADRQTQLEQIGQADVIFAQLTTDGFRPEHLSTRALQTRFGNKVIVWPNIFYLGQQPYLRYFTHPQEGRLIGPLEALHDLRLFSSWQRTGQVSPDVLNEHDQGFIAALRNESRLALQEKETSCDVIISDFIANHENHKPIFFTFNHPTRFILTEMSRRLLGAIGMAPNQVTKPTVSEPLGRYQVPSTWSLPEGLVQGDNTRILPNGVLERLPGPPKQYNIPELCQAYQHLYDNRPIYRTPEQIRLTPATPLNAGFIIR
jgi:hypothetical protein